jgi:hypothetical protein
MNQADLNRVLSLKDLNGLLEGLQIIPENGDVLVIIGSHCRAVSIHRKTTLRGKIDKIAEAVLDCLLIEANKVSSDSVTVAAHTGVKWAISSSSSTVRCP